MGQAGSLGLSSVSHSCLCQRALHGFQTASLVEFSRLSCTMPARRNAGENVNRFRFNGGLKGRLQDDCLPHRAADMANAGGRALLAVTS